MSKTEPLFTLGTLPSPLHRLERLEKALSIGPFYAKRDDLIGFAAAGNKTRPLEYLLGAAIAQSCDVLVTGGGPDSNFCHAAAAASAAAGLACELMMFVPESGSAVPGENTLLAQAFSARIHYLSGTGETVDAAIPERVAQLREQGHRPFEIPRGGSTMIGALGFFDAAAELDSQLRRADIQAGTVVSAVGSGATFAGLLAGAIGIEASWRLMGASVSRQLPETASRVLDLARQCARHRGTRQPQASDCHLVDAVGGGHGHLTQTQKELAHVALTEEGLFLDDTYTAKSFEYEVDVARRYNRPVVFWHTGGVVRALSALTKGAPVG
jgi:1-aminocyclopropane-1-carboxylate deaminase/D-cysteine desulfhydrase-like pyridoxal-dependent ACC family enzyme